MIAESSSQTPEEQLRLARAELRRRLEAGEACRAEEYLRTFPALAAREDLALGLILTEVTVRRGLGQQPAAEEWCARFPHLAERLRQHFSSDSDSGHMPATEVEVSSATKADGGPAVLPRSRFFGRYELLEELGHGGMGRVFKARDSVLGRVVALKVLRAGIAAHPEELLRFHREAQAVARLQHRHIVPVYDLNEQDGQPYLTMAYVPGGTLAAHRERFTGDVRAAVALVEKVARAVQVAHEQGIVHRDLKPGNVLLDGEGEPLVSDFGLAKLLDTGEEVTQTGQVLGTPAYMAPEQAAGQGHDITPATDVWALGVVLYEFLTGQRPFEGKGAEVARRIQSEKPPRPRKVNPALDRDLETVLLKCLAREPRHRYPSAGALAGELARWQQKEPIQARPQPWPLRTFHALGRATRKRGDSLLLLGILLVAGIFLAAFVSGLVGFSPRSAAEQDKALRAIERDLASGKPVCLLGKSGLPRYYRWRTEKGRPPLHREGRWPFTLESSSMCLLELLPDPQCEHYRLSAEVHFTNTNEGTAGFFFGADEQPTAGGPEHRFYALTFADSGRAAGKVTLQVFSYQEGDAVNDAKRRKSILRTVPLAPKEWHALSVEVMPGDIRATCDGQALPIKPPGLRQDIEVWWGYNHRADGAPPPPLAPRSALGLFVQRGAAWFRNVVVTPLEP